MSLSENLSPGAVQMFSGHESWTGVSPPGPAAMLSMPPAPNSPGASRSERELTLYTFKPTFVKQYVKQ